MIDYDEWQPIETAPKTLIELGEVYGDRLELTILVARKSAPCPDGSGEIAGCVGEAQYMDGKWVRPTHPEWVEFNGPWSEIVNPTHWKRLPDPDSIP
jgi:hypothetical protein